MASVPIVNKIAKMPCKLIAKKMYKELNGLPNDVLEKAANEALEKSGLAQKGVEILSFTPVLKPKVTFKEKVVKFYEKIKNIFKNKNADTQELKNFIKNKISLKDLLQKGKGGKLVPKAATPEELAKSRVIDALKKEIEGLFFGLGKHIPKDGIENIAKGVFKTVENGQNALFLSASNKIIMPTNLLGASFHEMGHALNHNTSKLWNIIAKGQSLKLLALPIGLLAAFTNKATSEDGTPLSTGEKIKNTIRDNAGKLAFACWIPTLLEEAKATINGNKLAKQVLSPDLAKKVAKSNKIAWFTYLVGASATGLAAWAGVKIKDMFTKNKN